MGTFESPSHTRYTALLRRWVSIPKVQARVHHFRETHSDWRSLVSYMLSHLSGALFHYSFIWLFIRRIDNRSTWFLQPQLVQVVGSRSVWRRCRPALTRRPLLRSRLEPHRSVCTRFSQLPPPMPLLNQQHHQQSRNPLLHQPSFPFGPFPAKPSRQPLGKSVPQMCRSRSALTPTPVAGMAATRKGTQLQLSPAISRSRKRPSCSGWTSRTLLATSLQWVLRAWATSLQWRLSQSDRIQRTILSVKWRAFHAVLAIASSSRWMRRATSRRNRRWWARRALETSTHLVVRKTMSRHQNSSTSRESPDFHIVRTVGLSLLAAGGQRNDPVNSLRLREAKVRETVILPLVENASRRPVSTCTPRGARGSSSARASLLSIVHHRERNLFSMSDFWFAYQIIFSFYSYNNIFHVFCQPIIVVIAFLVTRDIIELLIRYLKNFDMDWNRIDSIVIN